MKKTSASRLIAHTAVLLALTLAFQQLRFVIPAPASTWVISALVNAMLLLAGGIAGIWASLTIAVLAPLVALLQGHAQAPLLPALMLGNAMMAFAGSVGFERGKQWILAAASLAKYVVIALGMALLVRKSLDAAVLSAVFLAQLPQLAAFAGMLLALLVYPRLKYKD